MPSNWNKTFFFQATKETAFTTCGRCQIGNAPAGSLHWRWVLNVSAATVRSLSSTPALCVTDSAPICSKFVYRAAARRSRGEWRWLVWTRSPLRCWPHELIVSSTSVRLEPPLVATPDRSTLHACSSSKYEFVIQVSEWFLKRRFLSIAAFYCPYV